MTKCFTRNVLTELFCRKIN